MAVEFRTLTIDKCPYCGCTKVVEERIELHGSGEFNENALGRKEHRIFKCGCHAYTVYERSDSGTWHWVSKATGRCKQIIEGKTSIQQFMKSNHICKELHDVVMNAMNNIDLSKVDRRDSDF